MVIPKMDDGPFIDPTGQFLYIGTDSTLQPTATLWGYRIDPATGKLTDIPGAGHRGSGLQFAREEPGS
jgi:hypothetical protein